MSMQYFSSFIMKTKTSLKISKPQIFVYYYITEYCRADPGGWIGWLATHLDNVTSQNTIIDNDFSVKLMATRSQECTCTNLHSYIYRMVKKLWQ